MSARISLCRKYFLRESMICKVIELIDFLSPTNFYGFSFHLLQISNTEKGSHYSRILLNFTKFIYLHLSLPYKF